MSESCGLCPRSAFPAITMPAKKPRLNDVELLCLIVAQRLLDLAAGFCHNWLIGAPNKRSLIAFGHEDSLI